MVQNTEDFKTLLQTLRFLRERGYAEEFSLLPYCLECSRLHVKIGADEFEVDRLIHFRGKTPDEHARLFAITASSGLKGVLVGKAQGIRREVVPEMARKLLGTGKT